MNKYSLAKDKIKVLLLEGIHANATKIFTDHGYSSVENLSHALEEDELIEKIQGVHLIGIRSATKITAKVLEKANRLIAIGCFCIGTNQVALKQARMTGIPVFNAPYSNTRSVAELVIAEIIMLFRSVQQKSMAAHKGIWMKSAKDSYEIRGKTLGIIGYGHIGTQLSILAESLGMRVLYYDTEKKLALGNALSSQTLQELLSLSDVVSLHVPATEQTKWMIGEQELSWMKEGSYIINASRGNIIVIEDLKKALESRHLFGAALDVFPEEPASNKDEFISILRGLDNVIITPHVGGSTAEAQANIGIEVSEKLVKYSDNGSTLGAVNFGEVSLPIKEGGVRFFHIHANIPGVLRRINDIFSSRNINILGQHLQTDPETGYVVIDVAGPVDVNDIMAELNKLDGTIRARFLY